MKVLVTRRARWYIRIVAGNGETVAVTQRYYSKSSAVRSAKNIVDAANSERWVLEVDRHA